MQGRDQAPLTRSWQKFVEEARAGDVNGIRRICTDQGFATLVRQAGTEPLAQALKRWGEGWSRMNVRWKSQENPNMMFAFVGPDSKDHCFVLVKQQDGWAVDNWLPGD